jgi:hypothetical protein
MPPNTALHLTARFESPILTPETQSTFHPHAQRNASHRRDVRLQSRLFALRDLKLRHSPDSTRLS